jgi:hypothetical protein
MSQATAPPPRSEPYTDTLLLDCSRATSEEVKGDPTNTQNAVFTNKLGEGIKINPGDKISVSSAFVSERGCGGSVIEFKGEPVIGQTYDLTFTDVIKTQPPRFDGGGDGADWEIGENKFPDVPEPFGDIGPMNCHQVQHKRTTKTYPLKDNEVNLEISFYKTTNGEGYVHLPRRWDFTQSEMSGNVQEQATGDIPNTMTVRDPNRLNPEALGQGVGGSGGVTYDCAKNGRACISPNPRHTCPADWYVHKGLNNIGTKERKATPGGVPAWQWNNSLTPPCVPYAGGEWDVGENNVTAANRATYTFRQLTQDGSALNDFIMKQKNDNSRYTIYAKDICHYAEHICDLALGPSAANNLPTPLYEMPTDVGDPTDPADSGVRSTYYKRWGDPWASRDDYLGNADNGDVYEVSGNKEPSLSGYTRYTEIKNLKVPKGFNAPSNVAETLTNQLNTTRDQRTIKGFQGPFLAPFEKLSNTALVEANSTFADQRKHNKLADWVAFGIDGSTIQTTQRQIPVSTILESETLRSFACGNFNTFSRENFVGYRGQDPTAVGDQLTMLGSPAHGPPDRPSTSSVLIRPADPMELKNQVSSWYPPAHPIAKEVKTDDVMNIQYLSNYQYIGVKRPELFDAIREFYRDEITGDNVDNTSYSWRNLNAPQCLTGMPYAFRATCPYITTIEWTPENLLKVKAVFDAQAKYPELFSGYSHSNVELNDSEYKSGTTNGNGVSSDYMRFIHINTFDGHYPKMVGHVATAVPIVPGATTPYHASPYYYYQSDAERVQLGDDNMNQPLTHEGLPTVAASWSELNPSRNAEDFSSSPLFVWYNEADKDITNNEGDQEKGLAYGTMWKYTSGDPFFNGFPLDPAIATATEGKSYIAFNTKKIGGIPDFIFSNMENDFWDGLTPGGGSPVPGKGKGIPYPINCKDGTGGLIDYGSVGSGGHGRGCGFDIHFNAYGTSCIALYSGYLSGDKYAVEALKTGVNLPADVKGEYYYDRGCCSPDDLKINPYTPEADYNPATTTAATADTTSLKVTHAKAHYVGYVIDCAEVSHIPVRDRLISALKSATEYTLSGKVTIPDATEVYLHTVLAGYPTYGNRNISKFIRERYVGANSPLLAFDDKGERFNFQQLHTPIYIGNEANAGDGLTAVAETGGTAVVEINRRLLGNDFSPEMMPYGTPIQPTSTGKASADTTDDKTPPIQPMNLNLIPWQLYDSDGGIYLENFGLSEAQWILSLWGVLGFSYAQFNTETNNRQTRINNIVEGSAGGSVTTNANLEASDVVKFRGNRYGTSLYTNQPPIASVLGPYVDVVRQPNVDYPVISIDQTSAQVSAQNLPRKMLRPYFLIKSNIIGDMNYYGGGDSGQNLPIVCVINKENGFGDFYFQKGFDLEFTATRPQIITSVTTSIHDPDMRLSNVSGDSAVIFRITKQNSANLDVVQDVLQENQAVLMRHSEALRIAQEEQVREAIRNGQEISSLSGNAVNVGEAMANLVPPVFVPALPPGQVVGPFTEALAGMVAPLPVGERPAEIGIAGTIGGRDVQQMGRVETGQRMVGMTPEQMAEIVEEAGAPIGGQIGTLIPTNVPQFGGAVPVPVVGPGSSVGSSAPFTDPSDPAASPRSSAPEVGAPATPARLREKAGRRAQKETPEQRRKSLMEERLKKSAEKERHKHGGGVTRRPAKARFKEEKKKPQLAQMEAELRRRGVDPQLARRGVDPQQLAQMEAELRRRGVDPAAKATSE